MKRRGSREGTRFTGADFSRPLFCVLRPSARGRGLPVGYLGVMNDKPLPEVWWRLSPTPGGARYKFVVFCRQISAGDGSEKNDVFNMATARGIPGVLNRLRDIAELAGADTIRLLGDTTTWLNNHNTRKLSDYRPP
ncbi:hypothetical protein Bbelb_387540 [Branchiostoma belcheri]|nr:hypothetical protein Bbelb_387540 [Branchiostoma belcheri]